MPASRTSRKLTQREQKFVWYYLTEATATEAARKAGYRGKTPWTQAWRLLQREKIQKAIKEERQRLTDEHELTPRKLIRMLLNSYQSANQKNDAIGMLNAAREIGLLSGLYPSNK